jgi:chemotaxis protein methyltransferase CheR
VKPDDLRFLADLLKRRSGLVLGPDKAYLLESRLNPLARRLGHPDLDAMIAAMRLRPTEELLSAVTEAMTTNETLFFRDGRPFQQFADPILPRLIAARADRRRLRIWCAAASTGQEPYSVAMLIEEAAAKLSGWTIEILATDLSDDVLTRARNATYSQFEVQRGLPVQRLARFFRQHGTSWTLKEEVRRHVTFAKHNLLDDNRKLGQFDVVFCRNVLIYFDLEAKRRIIEQIASMLPRDGYLFLGGTETVLGITQAFEIVPEFRGIYVPVRSGQGAAAVA